jgi:hypothetical protein
MQQVMNDILKELRKTEYKKNKWGFDNWPRISATSSRSNQIYLDVFNNYSTFNITASLINDDDEIIASLDFPLYGQLQLRQGNIITVFSTQERRMVLSVSNEQLLQTDNIFFRLTSIDGYDADTANMNAYLRNSAVLRMPSKSRITIQADQQLVPELPEDREKRLAAEQKTKERQAERNERIAQEREKQKERESKRKAEDEIWETKKLKGRRNIYFSAGYNPALKDDSANALAFDAGLGFGFKNFSIDGRLVYPLYQTTGTDDIILGFGGALGYSYAWNNFMASLEGGATWYRDSANGYDAVTVPTLEAKFDIVPWKPGIGLRLGYKLEFGFPDKGELYTLIFDDASSVGTDSLRAIGTPSAGIVLWY